MAALDGRTGTSSFGIATFWILQTGGSSVPQPGRTARYQRDQIPYGSLATIQLAGYDDEPVELTAVLATADFAALRALVGTRQTLTLVGDVPRPSVLVSAGRPQAFRDGYLTVSLRFEF